MTGVIPQSNALSEATPESLGELLSRDPEGYQKQDREKIVKALRAQREKWAAAEASGTRQRATKVPTAELKLSSAIGSADDIGL